MKLSELIERTLFYVSVPKCISCGKKLEFTSKVYCPDCKLELFDAYSRNCSRCNKILSECQCSNEYLKSERIRTVIKLFRYIQREENYVANSLIYSLKKDNRKDVLTLASEKLSEAILSAEDKCGEYIFTNVPRRRAAVIKRGFDHAGMLAKAIAKRLSADYKALFVSRSKAAQKTLTKSERRTNASFKIKKNLSLSGKTVVIVDDVITTGSSVGACAGLAYSMGAKRVIAAAIGIAYKDEYDGPTYTPF